MPPLPPLSSLPGMASSTDTAVVPVSTAAVSLSTEAVEAEQLPPWVIGEIMVLGTKNVKPSVVRGQVKGKRGELYDRSDLERDRQNIYGLGSFDRVAIDISPTGRPVPEHFKAASRSSQTVVMSVMVTEKPVIRKIKFEGNKKLSKSTLSDAMTLKSGDPLDLVKLRENTDKMLDKYKERGFLAADITYRREADTATWHEDVIFIVAEGAKSKIVAVALPGVVSFKPKKIYKQFKNRRKKVFYEKDLPDDAKKIETFYLNKGYLDVAVGTPTVATYADNTEIAIVIPVREGRSYKFGETTFSGMAIYTSTQLAWAIEYREGKVFNHERYEDTVRRIQEMYADKGRLKMRVTPKKNYNQASGLMDVEYHISEGPIIYVDYVDIEGFKSTKRYVFERSIVVKPGEQFARSRVLKSRERILNLGFIDDVGIDFQESPADPERVGVIFDIVEGKPGLLTAGAAFSSVDGFIGTLSLSHLNLFGRAQRTSIQWQFGGRVNDYSISWYTPWILGRDVSLGLDLFNTRRILPFQNSLSGYVLKQTGGGFNVGPRFDEDKYQLNLGYTYKQITISNVEQRFKNIIRQGNDTQSAGSVSFARETRDSYWDPTRGSRHALSTTMSGGPFGGDIHFLKPSLYNARFFHLFSIADWPFVLGLYNRLDYVTQFGASKFVPVNERFFIGGQDSLRGYAADGEVGHPSGGTVREIFNAEFGFPLARERRKTIVKLVFFFDAGTSWDKPTHMRWKVGTGQSDIKTDVGIGVRFVTPAFPIRLDYGYGFQHRTGERKYQINFGLGNLF